MMYCKYCGHTLSQKDEFCVYCGKLVSRPIAEGNGGYGAGPKSLWSKRNRFTGYSVSKKLAVIAAAILVAAAAYFLGIFGHGLSGTYWTSDFFLVDEITFEKNGKFSAVSYQGDYIETYEGRYRKTFGGEYSLTFTDGTSNSGNSILNFKVSDIGSRFTLSAEKIDDDTLSVCVISKLGSLAWDGTTVNFYRN